VCEISFLLKINDHIRISCTVFIALFVTVNQTAHAQITLAYNTEDAPVAHAIHQFRQALAEKGQTLQTRHMEQNDSVAPAILVVSDADVIPASIADQVTDKHLESIQPEGFELRWINTRQTLLILAPDAVGAMYGVMEVVEHVQVHDEYTSIEDKQIDPLMEYRIVKFNLPWSPYRSSEATEVHMHVVRDLQYWEKFLDMMIQNRLNVLSLWNNHPFPFMIQAENFPEATPFDDQEMEEWQAFWRALFSMAKQRGIQTFVVNWNIVVSPEFAEAYDAREYNDLSEQVKQYTRESVTQLINEYEDLTGLGVTLADWMGTFNESMTPQEREDWIEDTFVAGMKAADREVKFIHRSVLAGDPIAMRRLIDRAELSQPVLVEVKFNWSHSHSTPKLAITHDYHSGQLDERFWMPMPENYRIQWMIRNEDFFILRWGQPDFVREHIAENNHAYVNGYYIGSEGYIPAVDYSHKPLPVKTWQYAFEKQWLFYKVWGRLLYDADAPDDIFASAFDVRYGKGLGEAMLMATKLSSNMPLRLASFHRSTWDYTLYSEGFISAAAASSNSYFDRSSPFITIDQFIYHETLEPRMLSIPDYIELLLNSEPVSDEMITPKALAESSEHDSREALELVASLRSHVGAYSGALESELDDIATWSYLGLYLADKLRAGVALAHYRETGDALLKQQAVELLELCLEHWDQVIVLTKDRYMPTPHVTTQMWGEEYQEFSWEQLRPQVVRDIQIAQNATSDN